ncbi:MAG: lipocalin-like domain-containing protein [Pseudomonadota bacterium]|nr:lipocalin-like domain-containing protein [Pseudomonadota bacterium]
MKHSCRNLFGLAVCLAVTFCGLGNGEEKNTENVLKPKFDVIDKHLKLQFPRDHGPHHSFRFEWWYITANLKDKFDYDHGAQFTLFRTALEPKITEEKGWNNTEVWMAHIASTDKNTHLVEEKFARGGISQAGVTAYPFLAWIDNWRVSGKDLNKLELSVTGKKLSYYLELEAYSPIIFHGKNGLSAKSDSGQASAYYSQPFYSASGWIEKNGIRHEVSGSAWLDHEWSSQFLSRNQKGWDWFSLNFSTGERLMLFKIRDEDGSQFYSGTIANSDGSVINLNPRGISIKPVKFKKSYSNYPTEWRIKIKELNVDILINALNPHSIMDTSIPYWEGPTKISGSHKGSGYLEMTGYEEKLFLKR